MEIRNIAIIAHVDHGKTTLTDAFLRQSGLIEAQSMDSDRLEQERGITIYSKNCSLFYKDTKINIVDTPGHADFSSEVERILRSIDCVLLVVDAQEGPMPQTKFVLKKSLELGLKPIVVINKVDKPAAQPAAVQEMVYELFLDLGATDEQLDFPVIFANGRAGIAWKDLNVPSDNLDPLLDTILEHVAPAATPELFKKPLSVQIFNLAYDNFLGRCGIGRIYSGHLKAGQTVYVKGEEGKAKPGKINKLFTFVGMGRKETDSAEAGDIVFIAGLPDLYIGETIGENPDVEPLPAILVDEPTISLNFLVNNSPLAGREGKFVTNRQIRERLTRELEVNVGLRIDFSDANLARVYGRGELHIAILLENMRREGYELQVSQPEVIIKETAEGKLEPFEEVTIDVPEKSSGTVIEKMSRRKGQLLDLKNKNGQSRLLFEIPTRGLLGYRTEFVVDTRGEGILYSHFVGFKPQVGGIDSSHTGSMISMISGKVSAFALWNLQERGVIYIQPNVTVYEGQVIGNVSKGNDLAVNPVKGKKLSNVRASGSDEAINLTPPWELDLERGLSIIKDDEFLEITPTSIRLRKQLLTEVERVRAGRKA